MLCVAQDDGVADIAILERGRCGKAEIVPSPRAVAVREKIAPEPLFSRLLLQAERGRELRWERKETTA